jgi:hypothetical protein
MHNKFIILAAIMCTISCSNNKINRNSISNSMPAIEKVSLNNEVVFKETGIVRSEASVSVTIDSSGTKVISSKGFKMTMDAKGNTVYDNNSVIYSGAAISMVTPFGTNSGFLSSFMGGKKLIRGPKDIAIEVANYHLIKKAREKGASALLLPSYEWEVKEDSETNSIFFGLIQTLVRQDNTYKVKASAKTIKFVPVASRGQARQKQVPSENQEK